MVAWLYMAVVSMIAKVIPEAPQTPISRFHRLLAELRNALYEPVLTHHDPIIFPRRPHGSRLWAAPMGCENNAELT